MLSESEPSYELLERVLGWTKLEVSHGFFGGLLSPGKRVSVNVRDHILYVRTEDSLTRRPLRRLPDERSCCAHALALETLLEGEVSA